MRLWDQEVRRSGEKRFKVQSLKIRMEELNQTRPDLSGVDGYEPNVHLGRCLFEAAAHVGQESGVTVVQQRGGAHQL